MTIYGEKGVKWRIRVLFTNNISEHTIHSASRAKATRIAQDWLNSTNVKAVELAEIRKVERITTVTRWDAQ